MLVKRRTKKRKVLDAGFVELIDFMGGDLQVVNSARQSYGKKQKKPRPEDVQFIEFLMEKRHGTPFETSIFTFQIKAPIFVVRQWQRHRIASYNERSGTFTKMENNLYIPEGDAIRKRDKKVTTPFNSPHLESEVISLFVESYNKSFITYERLLDMGVAKELARIVLPLALYTEFNVTVNARSLMNFLNQRNAAPAMLEIQRYAQVVEEFFEEKMPNTHRAFVANGRVAP